MKEGNTVKNYKASDDDDTETITVGGTVYFPEIDEEGNIDLGNWCFTREEAELKEKLYGFLQKLESEYQKLEKRKKDFWKMTFEELRLNK